MEIFKNEIQLLLTDLELMMAIETDPEKNQLRSRLVTRLNRRLSVLEAQEKVRYDLED